MNAKKHGNVERVKSEKSVVIKSDEKQVNVEEINTSELITSKVDESGTTSVVTQRRTTRSVTRSLKEELPEKKDESGPVCSLSTPCTVLSKLTYFLKTISYLIGGVIGLVMPIVFTYGMYLACKTKKSCTFLQLPNIPAYEKFFSWKSTGYVFGWFLFQLVLTSLPLGKKVYGPDLLNGKKQEHCLNGFAQFLISLAVCGGLVYCGKFPFKYITVNYLSLVTGSGLYGLVLSLSVYIISRKADAKEPSDGALSDFTNGRVISPMLGHVDLKLYAFKAHNISWIVLNLCFLLREVSAGKDILKTNSSFVMIQVFHMWYAADMLYFEESILYMAIWSKEKMGGIAFMYLMIFPYFSSQQARYLVVYPVNFPWHTVIIPILLHVFGYYIYRSSLTQKLLFRKDINKANELGITSIATKDGRGLLIDGFWGTLRHPNYTGDFMMIFGWSLLCGVSHVLPWIWVISLLPTLIAMANNDDEKCFEKYGESWTEYREKVKYKFIPFVC